MEAAHMEVGPESMLAGGIAVLLVGLVALVSLILTIIIWWKIFSKAGYSGAMGLLMLVPVANLVVLLILAFGTWPIHRELEQMKQSRSAP